MMLELLYIARFDYLAEPNSPDLNHAPDDDAVAMAIADADEAAEKDQKSLSASSIGRDKRVTLN
ncbi:hypothetical protein [Methylocystis sp. MJC1]|uniref:hypothetical protein n=2 Tax=Methylocystis sp. MJC1 TaxID=2654282 RepID=UPI0013EA02AE|nr:hypothetical protein [Methylocystis sp. MJC1]